MIFHDINVLFRVMCARSSRVFRKKQTHDSNDSNDSNDKDIVDIDILPHRILMLQMVLPDGNTQIVGHNLDKIVLEYSNCRINIRYANGVTKSIKLE